MNTPRILIVEDDKHLSKIMRMIITEIGYHCDSATTKIELEEYFEHHTASVILLDLHLPTTSPNELINYVLQECESAKLVLTSGDNGLMSQLAHLADAVLPKPYKLDCLEEWLQQWIGSTDSLTPNKEQQEYIP